MIFFLYLFIDIISSLAIAPKTRLLSVPPRSRTPRPPAFFYTYQKDAPFPEYHCYTSRNSTLTFLYEQSNRSSWETYSLSPKELEKIPPPHNKPNLSQDMWNDFVLYVKGIRHPDIFSLTYLPHPIKAAIIQHIQENSTPHPIHFRTHTTNPERRSQPKEPGIYFYCDPSKEIAYIHRTPYVLRDRLLHHTSFVHFVSLTQIKNTPQLLDFPDGNDLIQHFISGSNSSLLLSLSFKDKKKLIDHILSNVTPQSFKLPPKCPQTSRLAPPPLPPNFRRFPLPPSPLATQKRSLEYPKIVPEPKKSCPEHRPLPSSPLITSLHSQKRSLEHPKIVPEPKKSYLGHRPFPPSPLTTSLHSQKKLTFHPYSKQKKTFQNPQPSNHHTALNSPDSPVAVPSSHTPNQSSPQLSTHYPLCYAPFHTSPLVAKFMHFSPPLEQLDLSLFLADFHVPSQPSQHHIDMARKQFDTSPSLHNYIHHLLHLRHLYPDFVLHNSAHLFFLETCLKNKSQMPSCAYISLYQANQKHKITVQATFLPQSQPHLLHPVSISA